MSHPKDRGERLMTSKKVINKRLRTVKDLPWTKDYYEILKEGPNRANKKHPLDCGNSQCFLCHSDKLLGIKKAKDINHEQYSQDIFEQIQD
jgi:hypothetical protein